MTDKKLGEAYAEMRFRSPKRIAPGKLYSSGGAAWAASEVAGRLGKKSIDVAQFDSGARRRWNQLRSPEIAAKMKEQKRKRESERAARRFPVTAGRVAT